MESHEEIEFDIIDVESIKRLGGLLRHWWGLIVFAAVLSGVTVYMFSIMQTPIYQANIQVMIAKPSSQNQALDLTQALNSQQLAQTYVELLKQDVIRETVSERLQTDVKADQLSISNVTNTQIINISVEDPIPARAEAIANMLVDVLIERNNLIEEGRYAETEKSLVDQISNTELQISALQDEITARYETLLAEQKSQLEKQISDSQAEIAKTKQEITNLSFSLLDANQQVKLSDLRTKQAQLESFLASYQQAYTTITTQNKPISADDQELTRFEKTYNLYQQIYVNLLTSRENLRLARLQGTPNVVKLDQARVLLNEARTGPAKVRPRVTLNTLLGALVGLILVTAVVLLRDFLDDTLKSRDDVKQRLGLGVIGSIADFEADQVLQVASQPRSPVSESFRSLRSNLEYAGVDQPLRSLLVTSAGPGEGKTTISTNLAGILAQAGKKVLLIDADFRRPRVHTVLGIPNRFGLADLFRHAARLEDIIQPFNGPNGTSFQVMTTGALPPNPGELLSSQRMKVILEEALQHADLVIIDSPPAILADAQVLTTLLDGVVLVLRVGKTHAEPARVMVETLRHSQGRILGVVLNGIQPQHGYYGGSGYYNGYDYYGSNESELNPKPRKSIFPWFKKNDPRQG